MTPPPNSSRSSRPTGRAGARTLLRLLRDAEEFVATSKALRGDERDQVLADAQSDLRRLSAAWSRFTADEDGGESVAVRTEPSVRIPREREEPTPVPGALQVQVSWEPGRVVAWGGGPGHAAVDGDAVMAMLGAAGAPTSPWIHHTAVPLPRGAARGRVRGSGRRGPGMAGRGGRGTGRRRRAQRALVGTGRDLGRRAHRARRDGPVVAPTPAAARCREQLQGVLLGALDTGARRHRAVQPAGRRDAGQRAAPSTRASTRGR